VANDLFPLGPDTTPWKKLTDKHVSVEEFRGQEILTVDVDGLRLLAEEAFGTSTTCCARATSKQLAEDPRRSGSHRERPLRRLRPAEERQHRRRRRAADVPGHRHRDHHGQEGPQGLDRRRRRGGARRRRARRLFQEEPALFAARAALHVRGEEHQEQPAGADRHLCRRRGRLQVPVHRQGRRIGQQDLPVPGHAVAADPRPDDRVPEDAKRS
jgi:hypothetical protein